MRAVPTSPPGRGANGDANQVVSAFISPFWPAGAAGGNGIVTYVANLAPGLQRMGCRPLILAQWTAESPPDELAVWNLSEWAATGTRASRLWDRVLLRIAPDAARTRSRCRLIARAAAAAVARHGVQILEMEESFGWAADVRARLAIPVLVRLHGPWFLNGSANGARDDDAYRHRVDRELRGIREADAISAPSRSVLELTREYYKLPLEGAAVIPCPCPQVPADRRWKLDEADPRTILFVGRFDRHKGGDVIIDAFARLFETHPDARLRFVGLDRGVVDDEGRSWKLAEYVAARAPRAAAAGRIEMMGSQPATLIDDLRRRALVTAVPSRYETFGYTTAEAAALGAPIVASRVGGISEMVQDGETALLVPPGDPDALARALGRLLDDPSLAARLGEAAGTHADGELGPDHIARTTADFHRSIVERRRSAAPRRR
ncbi:glycosyltransferase family 4 protein [Paludisphaera mucosa]|uniref:Glycosyltransferase family 4 protein n=1 Tax=Paludisphaera mucosa TaxID=3030827 RepID=A0ABT6FHB0_9BACT|nr:glycosyltransferase family 4 protein [Paludisphaera mucosa]MDG3006778.1 glycosyltransferase family 4 protein [Paludisphaera mucosa]